MTSETMKNNLHELMSIIFDNQDSICEGDYLKMCNIMKVIHDSSLTEISFYGVNYNISSEFRRRLVRWILRFQNKFNVNIHVNKKYIKKLSDKLIVKDIEIDKLYDKLSMKDKEINKLSDNLSMKDRIKCKHCGSVILLSSLKRHNKSNKCMRSR
jgi:DNA-directed RNA polymerase subunit RPC12/RpoP